MSTMPGPASGLSDPGDFLGPLLRTLAESLDVREIFARIAAEARRIVPHDFLMLGLITEDEQRVRLIALSGELPEGVSGAAVPEALRSSMGQSAIVLNDMQIQAGGRTLKGRLRTEDGPGHCVEVEVQPLFRELVAVRGLRSFMRASVRLRGGVVGGMVFCSASPDAFPPAEVARACQIADCVALALAHQRLAEEEQRGAEARERASRLEARVRRLTEELEATGRHRILGRSRKWKDVLSQAAKVAATEATVLLTGESGTGKEVVARCIHRGSPRAEGPFVALNCAALPEQLLESELFGHEKGAFTGALAAHPGKIEQASGGVLFLDEVGEMSPAVQAKLLRVLAVFDIPLPALRERPEDILVLVDAFLEEIGRSVGRPAAGVSEEARDKLVAHAWPGNVRELRNAIERAVILCEGGLITSEHLPLGVVAAPVKPAAPAPAELALPPPGSVTLGDAQREIIRQALARAGNNQSKAARLLGLTRAQLRSRIEKYSLTTAR